MPKFYVGVVFQEVTEDNFYIDGEPHPRFIRIWVDHIARTFQSDEMRVNFFTYVNKLLAPFIADRGFEWELHVDETPFDLLMIQDYLHQGDGNEDDERRMGEH